MANQTVTTTVNYDDAAISGLLNGETITINAGGVTVNADVRWNQQAAVLGPVTISSTLGGSFLVDGTQIWEVPFSASSGNVPTQAALGSNGVTGGTSGATGELTRVWATGSLDPETAAAAMPATGFIKLRSRTGNFQAGETITLPGGATVTASSAGKRSWVHVAGRSVLTGNGSTITIPRLGTCSFTGDWYELGTTDGTDNQTIQYPVADQCPAIWIETAAGSGVYEIWLNAGTRWTDGLALISTTDKRGTYFGCTNAGVITLALRGANNNGLKPPTGCKIRIPNLICSNAEATNYAVNTQPSSQAQRYNFTTSAAGGLNLYRVSSNWSHVCSSAYVVSIVDSGINQPIQLSSVGTTTTITNVGCANVDSSTHTVFSLSSSYGGAAITDSFFAVTVVRTLVSVSSCSDIIFTRVRADVFPAAGVIAQPLTNAQAYVLFGAVNVEMIDCIGIGATAVLANPAIGLTITRLKYASLTNGTTQTNSTNPAFNITNSSKDIVIDGFESFDGLANVQPYTSLITLASNVDGIEIKNIGTPSAPYDLGNLSSRLITASATRNLKMRRVYTSNTRIGGINLANSVQDVDLFNVWGDTTDAIILSSNNTIYRGGRFSSPTTGNSATYGTHWMDAWTSTTAGFITIACNEPSPQTLAQCTATLDSTLGSGFNGGGSVRMSKLTDVVEWTMPYYALGVTGFANVAPTITGTNAANHTLQFQWDTGSGFNGTWLALTGANLSGIGAINPAIGVKLKVRATVNTAASGNLLTYIRIDTVTNATDQQIEYPLPGSIVNVNNLISNSRVKLVRLDTGAVLQQQFSGAGSTVQFDVQYTGQVSVEARNASSSPAYQPWVSQLSISPTTPISITALQAQD
jgi:hypothetical protein